MKNFLLIFIYTFTAKTISVMAYYTPEFEREFSNPVQEIRRYIEATNVAFDNSKIGIVKLELHCAERIDAITDSADDTSDRLDALEKAKGGDVSELLQSADIAVLVTKTGQGRRGVAYRGSYVNSEEGYVPPTEPIAWVKARNPLIFAHEVAHILGAIHNREEYTLSSEEKRETRFGYNIKEVTGEGSELVEMSNGAVKAACLRAKLGDRWGVWNDISNGASEVVDVIVETGQEIAQETEELVDEAYDSTKKTVKEWLQTAIEEAQNGICGKMTIMSYGSPYHHLRVPYFSGNYEAKVGWGSKSVRMGDSQNNVRDQIYRAAPILAKRGDESKRCPNGNH